MAINISVNPNSGLFDTKTGKMTREGFQLIRQITDRINDATSDYVLLTATQTVTNKTIDGDVNTLRDIGTGSLKTKTGPGARVVTADAAGTSGALAVWQSDGDVGAVSAAAGRTFLGLTPAGTARLVNTFGTNDWIAYTPEGAVINTSSSTTDGLQEIINYCDTNVCNLQVLGTGILNCSTAIAFGAMQGRSIWIDFCTINFTGAVTGAAVTFNSCMMVSFICHAQIVYVGNAAAVFFNPTTNVQPDNVTTCIDSNFFINTIACVGGTNPIGVRFRHSTAAIQGCVFEFIEINGANGPTTYGLHGIEIEDAANGFIGNTIRAPRVHKWANTTVRIGTATTNGAAIHSNTIDVVVWPDGASAVGIQVYGVDNAINCAILNNEGTVNEGIKLESSAARNVFKVIRNDATTKVTNNATVATNVGMYGNADEYIESVVAVGSAVALTTGTVANVSSISLSPGEWDISTNTGFDPDATTSITRILSGISLVSATGDTTAGRSASLVFAAVVPGANANLLRLANAPYRLSVTATTTVYHITVATFTVAALRAFGVIRARRVKC